MDELAAKRRTLIGDMPRSGGGWRLAGTASGRAPYGACQEAAASVVLLPSETTRARSPAPTRSHVPSGADYGVSSQTERPNVAARTREPSAAMYRSVTLTSGRPAP